MTTLAQTSNRAVMNSTRSDLSLLATSIPPHEPHILGARAHSMQPVVRPSTRPPAAAGAVAFERARRVPPRRPSPDPRRGCGEALGETIVRRRALERLPRPRVRAPEVPAPVRDEAQAERGGRVRRLRPQRRLELRLRFAYPACLQ
jgi:hypothetical protein